MSESTESTTPAESEFFIGWQGKAPEQTGRFLRNRVIVILFMVLGLGAAFAGLQQTIGRAWFDFGNVQTFEGLLVKSPVPMLLAEAPDDVSGESVYLLVNPFKYGYPEEQAEAFHLKPVTIRGTLIHNESGGAMIEVVETQVREGGEEITSLPGFEEGIGEAVEMTLSGEIVDSKCWLGVMNPGALKPHRACAINCIRGGIPPVLLVDRKAFYVLVGPQGEAINEAVIPHVALSITVSGMVTDHGKLKVIRVDPEQIQRTGSGTE